MASQGLAADGLDLQLAPETSTDGVASLSWQVEKGQTVILQQASTAGFADARPIYQGADSATTLTGLEDGTYHYRVGTPAADGAWDWSEPVTLTVAHHSLGRAFTFFAVGVVVFLSTLALIVQGARRTRVDS